MSDNSESEPISAVSSDGTSRLFFKMTAPFRGYGMERIPGLRSLYRGAYAAVTPPLLREIKLPTMRLLVDYADTSIVPSLRFTKAYEATFSRAVDSLIRPGQTVVDVGAHVGYHAVRFAQAVGPSGRVHAYEPEHLLSTMLSVNVERNNVSDWTSVYRKGVSVGNAPAKLWRNGTNTGGASLSEACVDGVTGSTPVDVVSLDTHLLDSVIPRTPIDLIKVDVQGHEAHVIEGASEIVRLDRPVLAFEYNPQQLAAAGSDPLGLLSEVTAAEYNLYFANEYDHTVRRLGASAIHEWCVNEKPDGSGGFVNVVAVHRAKDAWAQTSL